MSQQTRGRIPRRKYVVDRRLQIAVALQMASVLAAMGLLYTAIFSLLPKETAHELGQQEMRSFPTAGTAIYFVLTTAILATVAFIVTQRIAGPAYVFRRAVAAMLKGDYSTRLALRKRDHFKDLAAGLAELREQLRHAQTRLSDLARCVQEGDFDAARKLADRAGVSAQPAAAAATES